MDVAKALADLTEASSQIDAAVVVGDKGEVLGSTLADAASAKRMAEAGAALVEASGQGPGGRAALTDLVLTFADGAVVCSRAEGRTIVAVTVPDPTIGLVLHDLRAALRAAPPKAKRTVKPKPKPKAKAKAKPRGKAADA